VRGDTEQVYAARGVLDGCQGVEPGGGDCVAVEEVQGHDPGSLCSQELFPGRAGSAWRRVDTGLFQDRPHGGWRDWVAEAVQLAVDSPVTPVCVLPGKAQDQGAQWFLCRWSTCSAWLRPAALDQVAVPAQECCGGDRQTCPPRLG
jgi:hypothetical protein